MLSLNDTAFTLDRRHRGRRVHVTDAVPAGRVLAYGRSVRLGPFRCRSRTTGLTCRSRPSGHGFALSRERQRVFSTMGRIRAPVPKTRLNAEP